MEKNTYLRYYETQAKILKNAFLNTDDVVWVEQQTDLWFYTAQQTIGGWVREAVIDDNVKNVVVVMPTVRKMYQFMMFVYDIICTRAYIGDTTAKKHNEVIEFSNGTTITFVPATISRKIRGLGFDWGVVLCTEENFGKARDFIIKHMVPVMQATKCKFVLYSVGENEERESEKFMEMLDASIIRKEKSYITKEKMEKLKSIYQIMN